MLSLVSTSIYAVPAAGSSCTASALNRNAAVDAAYGYTLYNVPADQGILKVRVTCSDGTVGQTRYEQPVENSATFTGDILWGTLDPIPMAISLNASTTRLSTAGQTLQLSTTALDADGTTRDITPVAKGTFYTSSNPQLAAVSADGLISVASGFSATSSAQVVISATNEGLATSMVLTLGPQGRLTGSVLRADGITPVSGAQVSVQRNQPLQQVGTYTADSSGNFDIPNVSAGTFTLSVIDPATGDRGRGFGTLATEGQTTQVDMRLNGQGTVNVQVLDGSGNAVAGLPVTITSLSAFRDTRTADANSSGQVAFSGFPSGSITVSARQASTNLLGTALGKLDVNGNLAVTIKLQPVGAIQGTVYATDGITAASGIQVRLLSAAKGMISQTVTGDDGAFNFDSLPTGDSPYTLDAVENGRLRARVAGLVLSSNQQLTQNLTLTPVGTVTGQILSPTATTVAGASVVVQSLGGLRSTFNTVSDANGVYRVDGVPLGNFALVANSAGSTASVSGAIASDGQVVNLDVKLQANGVIGVVYGRDGQTPVGAGVTVTLIPGNASTTTDTQGHFGFATVTPNNYTLEAADGNGNRGRTQLFITTVDATKAIVANITYLGRGSVIGVVRDANGNIQSGQPVTFTGQGIFGGTASGTTDTSGAYRFDGVFVGDFTVSAQNSSTKLAGVSRGTMLGEGNTVTADVTLRATGSVAGVARKANGTILAGGRVELKIGGSVFATMVTDATGAYRFDLVPLGDFTLVVTDLTTGDKGLTNSSLTTLNEVRTANVNLIGQGQVTVQIADGSGQPVSGATVYIYSSSLFGGSYSATTGSTGVLNFGPLFSGDFTVSASKPAQVGAISGSASGTVLVGQTVNANITLTSRPVGRISGVVYAPDGITPLSGVTLRLAPFNRDIQSGVDGSYVFNSLEGGTSFSISALVNGRVRARTGNVQISSNDETVVQNLTLIGIGAVHGTVFDANQRGVGGITVRLNNPDPTLGGQFNTTTQADGTYSYAQIPAGNFLLTATNAAATLRAEGNGRVRFDGDNVTVDIVLVDNAITMPRTLYDANNLSFDVQGNGAIGVGSNNVYNGNGATDSQGLRLDIVSSGVAIPFTNGNGTLGSIGIFGQQVAVDEVNALGLKVSRRVYVPKNGYFARYLELIENPTSAPITVDVRVTSNISASNGSPRVADSSDGDDILSVAGTINPDRWVMVDDLTDADPFLNSSIPAVVNVFDGAGAVERAADAGLSLVGQVGKLHWQWSSVTVPAGGSVAYMHFAVQQLNRVAARAAAERLAQLPPEALDGLTPVDLSAIRNFAVPLDGISTIAPLPAVNVALIQGQVLSGDSTTPIANATVNFQSQHPLFGRSYSVGANAQGNFSLSAKTNGDGQAMAIPLAPFTLSARNSQTNETTPNTAINFPENVTSLTHDLVFINTGNVRGSVTRHNGVPVSSGSVQVYLPSAGGTVFSNIDANGNYGFTGFHQGGYSFTAIVPHPQGQGLTGSGSYSIVAGQTSIANISIEPTGTITGVVRTFAGEPVVNAVVYLDRTPPYTPYRTTRTDTAGLFTFSDVSVGVHTVITAEPRTGTPVSTLATVTVDQVAAVALSNPGVGTISVQVNFARGGGAPNARVSIGNVGATTDSSGRANFTRVVGSYTPYATHPNNNRLTASGSATLDQDGGTVPITITLPSAGVVTGVVRRADGITRAPGLAVSLLSFNPVQGGQILSATTDAQGIYRIAGVPDGSLYLKVIDSANSTFADANSAITSDGQELTADLILLNNTIQLPVNRYDANNFLSDIQQNGVILSGQDSVFKVGATPRRGAALLQLSDAAATYNFTGNNSATLSALGRQLSISQVSPIAGLNVSRKVFVPSSGYFTRYLEILDNPGTSAVTVNVQIDTRYAGSNVITTSSGDTNLDTVTAPDYWVTMDDSVDADPFALDPVSGLASVPATAHVFGVAGASHLADVLDFRVEGDSVKTLGYRFNAVTVPAGGKVVLMHFVVEQINRAGAKASAERLVQLPPEALEALAPDEITAIANMPVPANGLSAVAQLSGLNGSISGRVLEGDSTTAVSGVSVRIKSSHPLFNRTWQYCGGWGQNSASLISTANGNYNLVGRIIEGNSVPLPTDADLSIQVSADICGLSSAGGHPLTGVQSPLYTQHFATGTNILTQDIVFPTGILTGTVVGSTDFAVTSGRISLPAANGTRAGYVPIRSDGSYTYPGLAAGMYTLNASVPHTQGTGLTGTRTDAVATVGSVTVVDVPLQATGAISGTILTATGVASANSQVVISSDGFYRQTVSDSLGRYVFTAVPVGSYSLTVRDTISGATTSAVIVSVGQNQTTTQNASLLGLGSVQLQVNFARGVGAFDVPVYLQAAAFGSGEILAGRTDLNGRVTIANIPVGNFSLRARHPAISALSTVLTGSISTNGEAQQGTLVLRPVANIALTVLNQDSNNAPVAGASVELTDTVNGKRIVGTSGSTGLLNISNVPEGNYTILVTNASNGAAGGVTGAISVADDGQTLARTALITADRSVLGVIAYNYEQDIYSFAAKAGDVIAVRVYGLAVDTSPSLYLTFAQLVSPSRVSLATGYGYDSRNSNLQYNQYGNLSKTVASVTGNYSIAASAYYSNYNQAGYSTGGYKLRVTVNGLPVALGAYVDGGSITGHLYRVDGTTPVAGQRVNLSASGNLPPFLNANVVTDAAGSYTFTGVPFANYTLAAIDADQRQPISVGVQVANATPVVTNLTMPMTNTLNISVVDGGGVAITQAARVDVTDVTGTRALNTDTTGKIATSVYGSSVALRAYDPNTSLASDVTVTPTTDGGTVPVSVSLAATGTLTGLVTSGGTPVPNAQVSVSYYVPGYGWGYGNAKTNGSGVYTANYLPVGVVLNVSTYHPQNSVIAYSTTAQLVLHNEIQTLDLTLAAVGSISGRVAYASGSPAASVYVYAINTATGAQLGAYTDANGNYQFAAIEVGVPMRIQARNPATSSMTSLSATITTADQVLSGQNLTFEPMGSITGRVLSASGTLLVNQWVYASYVYDAQSNYTTTRSAYTGATGIFRFDNLPVGQTIPIYASHPTVPYLQTKTSATLATDGQILTLDLTHIGTGSINGQVVSSDGVAVANSYVTATYVYNTENNYTYSYGTYTNALGQYRFDNLPIGQPIALRAYNPINQKLYTNSSETLVTDGQVLAAAPIVLPMVGSLRVSLVDAEGVIPSGSAYIYVKDSLSGVESNKGYISAGLSPSVLVTNVSVGAYTVRAVDSYNNAELANATGNITSSAEVPVNLVTSLIKGVVRYSDGTVVANPSVLATQTAANEKVQTRYARTLADGSYRILGAAVGAYTLTAQDGSSGLQAVVSGNLASSTTAGILDVTLQASGAVTGTVRDAAGNVVPNARLALNSTGLSFTRWANADATGQYRFDHVALGDISVYSVNYANGYTSMASGNLAVDGATAIIDIVFPALTSVTGTVFASDGITPVAGASVTVESLLPGSPFGSSGRDATADSLGVFVVNNVQVGKVSVLASDPLNSLIAGLVTGTVSAATSNMINVVLGNATRFNYQRFNLDGNDSYRYDISCDGSLLYGGNVTGAERAYYGGYSLQVNGGYYPCVNAALLENGARQLVFGAGVLAGLDVTRKVFVPVTGGYVRYLEFLHNPGSQAVTMPVTINARLDSVWLTTIAVSPQSTNMQYAVTYQRVYCCDAALGHVFASTGARLGVKYSNIDTAYGSINYQWSVTIPAGGTVGLMHFGIQRIQSNIAGVQAQADALVSKTDPYMFDGMSAVEKSEILNFAIP
jgi:hypothetical protein